MKWLRDIDGTAFNCSFCSKIEISELEGGEYSVIAHHKHEAFILGEYSSRNSAEEKLYEILRWLTNSEEKGDPLL
jgi:hypothetical protein